MIKYFVVILIGLAGINYSFAEGIYEGKSDQELLRNYVKEWIGVDPISEKYIYNVAYVGMTEEEFLSFFTWSKEFEGTLRPYIVKHDKGTYYLKEPVYGFMKKELHQSNISNIGTSRIKFKNGRLVKYEVQYRDKPPFAFLVYSDRTYRLIGHKYFDGLYKWMPEDEFLSGFNEKIVKKYEEGYYSIKDKDGVQYGVTFLNGFLDDVWKQ